MLPECFTLRSRCIPETELHHSKRTLNHNFPLVFLSRPDKLPAFTPLCYPGYWSALYIAWFQKLKETARK